jgi:hypothetical protein
VLLVLNLFKTNTSLCVDVMDAYCYDPMLCLCEFAMTYSVKFSALHIYAIFSFAGNCGLTKFIKYVYLCLFSMFI